VLETNGCYRLNPKGEPQLGKRGLYRGVAGGSSTEAALLWVLNFSDGEGTLLDLADRSGLAYPAVREAAETLRAHGLLAEVEGR
jgi:aminopeptidase-like protein